MMMRNAVGICLLLSIPLLLHGQQRSDDSEISRIRRQKLESILRLRDLRTPHDGALISALTDPDPVVRLYATEAYGSLQDSSVIGSLIRNLSDPDPAIGAAAAFAIGQTGTRMGTKSRQDLEEELLRVRLPGASAPGRLIEELGKFGTAAALDDLVIRVANVPPVADPERLCMSIARFAIRGIVAPQATRYLLGLLHQGTPVPWEAVYALQRIGEVSETRADIESIRLLLRDRDPLVRMNAASLMGKLRDAGGTDAPLLRLVDHDPDWRVRVNAMRALAPLGGAEKPEVIGAFRRGLFDANVSVAITAASLFPQLGIGPRDSLPEAIDALSQLAIVAKNTSGGFHWNLQAEAALSRARITRTTPAALFDTRAEILPKLRARLLVAAGESNDTAAPSLLLNVLNDEDEEPAAVVGALDGLGALLRRHPDDHGLRERVFAAAKTTLERNDVAARTTAAGLLGDSLLRRPEAVPPLLALLESLRPPDDTEALQEVIGTLGKLGDPRSFEPMMRQLQSPDPAVAAAAVDALHLLTGNDYSGRIRRRTEPLYQDLDFAYLRRIPQFPRVRLSTSRGDILIELNRDSAPFTVMSMLKLSEQRGFFRGLTFHRVVPNFVIQGGDPRGDGWGGPGYSIRSEFSPLAYETGTVGMASAGKDTEGSQFFITHSPQPHLDGRYTIIGRVVGGMEIVNAIQVDDRIYDIQKIE